MKKLNIIISLLLTIFFLTSCVPNVDDKATTEPTITDITEQKIQIDSKKISDNFTWDDYLKYAQSEGAVIIDLENYFNAYFFVIEKFKRYHNILRPILCQCGSENRAERRKSDVDARKEKHQADICINKSDADFCKTAP